MTVISLFGDHPLASQFEALHPEDVLDAVETPERRCTGRFLVLNSYENRVYQLELEDESYIVGKFYRPGRWSPEAILDEHRFIDELAELEALDSRVKGLGDMIRGELINQFEDELGEIRTKLDQKPADEPPDGPGGVVLAGPLEEDSDEEEEESPWPVMKWKSRRS